MLRVALALLAGHCAIQWLPVLPGVGVAGVTLTLACVCLARRWHVPASMLIGMLWAWGHATWALAGDLRPDLEGQDLEVRGRVASLPEATPGGRRFVFDLLPSAAERALPLPRRVELTWYDAPAAPRAGEAWQFTVRLRRRHGYANPGGFDYEAQLFREGIGATGYVRNDGDNRRVGPPSMRHAVLRVREHLAERLAGALPGHPLLSVVQGLAVGERQGMTADQWRVFAATGTSHLMAISGLHIAMAAALFAMAGGAIAQVPGMQRRRFAAADGRAVGCMVGATAYSLLAGFGVPAQRTLVMIGVFCVARLARRELRPSHGLAVSLIAVLAIDPFAPLSIGAWLSFGAVGAILWLLSGRVTGLRQRDWRMRIAEFLRTQWAVTAGLLPLTLLAFGSVSPVAPLVNLVAIPLFTLVLVPLVLAGTALHVLCEPVGAFVLQHTADLLAAGWPLLAAVARSPFALWHVPHSPGWVTAMLLAGAVLTLAPVLPALRLLGALFGLPALLWQPAPVGSGEFRFTLLDVGQGLAAVVETRAHVLLYDAGPSFRSGRDTGEMVVLPFLRSRAIRALDVMVISHGDADHAGGVASVLASMPVRHVFAGPSVKPLGRPLLRCRQGQRWHRDGVAFEMLHPGKAAVRSDNDSSCVLRVTGAHGSVLLAGDIERDIERRLVAEGRIGPVDVIVAPHHGSRTSSTAELVDAVRPRHVLFAAGYRNRWDFSRTDVVARWQAAGASVHGTSGQGAIELTFVRGGTAVPVAWRSRYRRYWHAPPEGPG